MFTIFYQFKDVDFFNTSEISMHRPIKDVSCVQW